MIPLHIQDIESHARWERYYITVARRITIKKTKQGKKEHTRINRPIDTSVSVANVRMKSSAIRKCVRKVPYVRMYASYKNLSPTIRSFHHRFHNFETLLHVVVVA